MSFLLTNGGCPGLANDVSKPNEKEMETIQIRDVDSLYIYLQDGRGGDKKKLITY